MTWKEMLGKILPWIFGIGIGSGIIFWTIQGFRALDENEQRQRAVYDNYWNAQVKMGVWCPASQDKCHEFMPFKEEERGVDARGEGREEGT